MKIDEVFFDLSTMDWTAFTIDGRRSWERKFSQAPFYLFLFSNGFIRGSGFLEHLERTRSQIKKPEDVPFTHWGGHSCFFKGSIGNQATCTLLIRGLKLNFNLVEQTLRVDCSRNSYVRLSCILFTCQTNYIQAARQCLVQQLQNRHTELENLQDSILDQFEVTLFDDFMWND